MSFEFKELPEVYQVEATPHCQLACPMCPRSAITPRRPLEVEALRSWVARGDFAGSYFVELQLAGEPLLHPRLRDLVAILKDAGMLVGLSTNGVMLAALASRLAGVDLLTVSLDSLDPARYGAIRRRRDGRPGDLAGVVAGVDALLSSRDCPPCIDLQLVVPLGTERSAVQAELAEIARRWPDPRVTARYVQDCSAVSEGRAAFDVGSELCVNPWASVSVQSDGTVVSCCYEWGRTPENVYGNLNEMSMREIWLGEPVAALRRAHRAGQSVGHCATCYLRSPFLLHLQLAASLIRRKEGAR